MDSTHFDPALAEPVSVADSAQLVQALAQARPGTVITLKPGTYPLHRLELRAGGEKGKPITVRAERLGDAHLVTDEVELFVLRGPYWVFENLDLRGKGDAADHAFHIEGGADRTILRHDRMRDFNAAVKGNIGDGKFADDVVIEDSLFYNAAPRQTDSPVTPIDIDGGRRWDVRGNLIADFAKAGGNQISYGAFMKAGSSDGIFERNLVICEWRHKGFTRIGLSFGGGGGETPEICQDRQCSPKHRDGIIRNNIILHCPADLGIYLNEARHIGIFNNTLLDTGGIDVRFPASSAEIRNNIVSGRIRERNGGTLVQESNMLAPAGDMLQSLFADADAGDFRPRTGAPAVERGPALAAVPDDFCGRKRSGSEADLGAVAYDGPACDRMRELMREAVK
ncbi:MAG TPA: right-handed parallel beta-helix repeat-containing protein [Aliidongia sp.]|nr:right-handed parallel beta-helix repeat-containing protein [Aliidongia sp.]